MSKRRNATRDQATTPQQVRIIAGCWKGRKIPVVQKEGVRPTPNRVRETLFNWLQDRVVGSHCLDIFAGSGALGLESVSRGAAHATIVDHDAEIIQTLQTLVELLASEQLSLVCDDAINYIANTTQKFDIVYLDPPFQKFDLNPLLCQLFEADILKPQAFIYVENPPDQMPLELPSNWRWWRQAKAGQVAYGLIATS